MNREFKEDVAKLKKAKFEKMSTVELLTYKMEEEYNDVEWSAWWETLLDREPFQHIQHQISEMEAIQAKIAKDQEALWKALRKHKHHGGRVVRDL